MTPNIKAVIGVLLIFFAIFILSELNSDRDHSTHSRGYAAVGRVMITYDNEHMSLVDIQDTLSPEDLIQNYPLVMTAEWYDVIPEFPRFSYHYKWDRVLGYEEKGVLLVDYPHGVFVIHQSDIDSQGRLMFDSTVVAPPIRKAGFP